MHAVARFGFGVVLNLLRTCPKLSLAYSDGTTTVLDNKKILFFAKYFLLN